MDFWFEFFDIHMNEKTITCHAYYSFKKPKLKYLPDFDYFSLQSDALFGSLDCDYTLLVCFHPKGNIDLKQQQNVLVK